MSETTHNPVIDACIRRVFDLEDEVEIVEVSLAGRGRSSTVRVHIYLPGGVTIDDCERINRRLLREIESEEDLMGQFGVEVSSPGLDRKLSTRRDFERVVGEVLCLRVEEEGLEKEVVGLLTEVETAHLLLEPHRAKEGSKKKTPPAEPFRVPIEEVRFGTIEVIL